MTFTVFLDRDGVFNQHHERPLTKPSRLDILPGVPEAFARLNRPDVQTSLCTNQPWVGMLMATPGAVRRTNAYLQELLAEAGGRLDHIEAAYAPPGIGHRRRKPKPGMLEDAAAWFADTMHPVDKSRAVMIGDKPRDALAGAAFGIENILLATTQDEGTLQQRMAGTGLSVPIVPDLPAAIELVLGRLDKD